MIPDWHGETVVCLGAGPSLTAEDVERVRGRARVIAVNLSIRLAPWADALYACDQQWWRWYPEARSFPGLKYGVTVTAKHAPGVYALKVTGTDGLELQHGSIRTGRNSGYQALNLAVQTGAKRILLLGYDMQRGPKGQTHWHPEHPIKRSSPYPSFVKAFATLPKPLKALGVDVINCSRRTALTMFPQMSIEDALAREAVAA